MEVNRRWADMILFDAPSYLYLPYRYGTNLVNQVIKRGRVVEEKNRA